MPNQRSSRKDVPIIPHKGGRTVKKSTVVSPEVDRMLKELWQERRISLGDIVDEAVRKKYLEVKKLAG